MLLLGHPSIVIRADLAVGLCGQVCFGPCGCSQRDLGPRDGQDAMENVGARGTLGSQSRASIKFERTLGDTDRSKPELEKPSPSTHPRKSASILGSVALPIAWM